MKFSAALLATAYAATGSDWNWAQQGEDWKTDSCDSDVRQSPIDIHPGIAKNEFSSKPFVPVNYDKQVSWNVSIENEIKMSPNADDIT